MSQSKFTKVYDDKTGLLVSAKLQFGRRKEIGITSFEGNGQIYIHFGDFSKCGWGSHFDATKVKRCSLSMSEWEEVKEQLDHATNIAKEMLFKKGKQLSKEDKENTKINPNKRSAPQADASKTKLRKLEVSNDEEMERDNDVLASVDLPLAVELTPLRRIENNAAPTQPAASYISQESKECQANWGDVPLQYYPLQQYYPAYYTTGRADAAVTATNAPHSAYYNPSPYSAQYAVMGGANNATSIVPQSGMQETFDLSQYL